jgi:hypothetical protein
MLRLSALLGFLCLLLTSTAFAQRIPKNWDAPVNGVSRAWLRKFYFYQPRVLPLHNLPPNYWLNARQQAERLPLAEPDAMRLGIQSFGSWEFMGPDETSPEWSSRVNAIVIDRTNSATIYAGVAKGGVWKSTDSGATWTNLTDTITQWVGCLTQDPVNANTLYLGTGEEYYNVNAFGGVGIYKSTDGGATWTLYGNSTFAGKRINAIVIDPNNTNKWIVSCDAGVYTSTDNGATFTQRLDGAASALRMHPTNAQILYAGLGYPFEGRASNGVYKSTDGGINWTKLAGGLPASSTMGRIELDIHKANPNIVYAAIGSPAHPFPMGYWGRSTDGGATWTSLPLPAFNPGQNQSTHFNFALRADPVSPTTAYVGVIFLHRTTDLGANWIWLGPDHPDVHAIEFDPGNASKLYLGNDGGLYYSTSQGDNLLKLNRGRGTMEYYAFDAHPTDPQKLIAGAQDNGVQSRTDSTRFTNVGFGDGMFAAYKKSDPSVVLTNRQFGSIYRSTDGGNTSNYLLNIPGAYWVSPLVNDPTTPSRFYAGGTAVYRSTNDGANWGAVSGNLDGTSISAICVAPNSSDVVYVGTFFGSVFVTTNGLSATPTWTDRTLGLPGWYIDIGGIAVDPANPNTVYVGMKGFTTERIWRSNNGGATWTNYTGDLPNAAVFDMVVNPVDPTQLIAATDAGVFLTSNGSSWSRYGSGLPNTPVTRIIANAATGYLSVSTYGRGVWRILLPGINPLPILNSISPNSAAAGSGAFTLTVSGDNFVPVSKVRWNGTDRVTTYVNATTLTAAISASDVATAGTANVTVFNPAPQGGTSAARPFTITGTTATFSGNTTGAPTYHRTDEGNPPSSLSSFATDVPYLVFKVDIPASGSYNFEIASNYDAFSTLYVSVFNPYPPIGPLDSAIIANDDKGGTTSRTGFDGVELNAGTVCYLVVSGYSNGSAGTFSGTISGAGLATVTPLRYIKGKATLQGLSSSAMPETLTFQLRRGSGEILSQLVPLASDGSYALIGLLPEGYSVSTKPSKWLRRTIARDVTANNISGADFTLLTGDGTNDNSVDISDLLRLIAAYNQPISLPGYDESSDFSGDGVNDITDLLLLIGNYNRQGDNP